MWVDLPISAVTAVCFFGLFDFFPNNPMVSSVEVVTAAFGHWQPLKILAANRQLLTIEEYLEASQQAVSTACTCIFLTSTP